MKKEKIKGQMLANVVRYWMKSDICDLGRVDLIECWGTNKTGQEGEKMSPSLRVNLVKKFGCDGYRQNKLKWFVMTKRVWGLCFKR